MKSGKFNLAFRIKRCEIFDHKSSRLVMEPIPKFTKLSSQPTFSFDTADDNFRFFTIGLGDTKIKLKLLAFSIDDIERHAMWSEYMKRMNDLRDQNALLARITEGDVNDGETVTAYFDRTRVTVSLENITIESDNFCVAFPYTSKLRRELGDALRSALTEVESED